MFAQAIVLPTRARPLLPRQDCAGAVAASPVGDGVAVRKRFGCQDSQRVVKPDNTITVVHDRVVIAPIFKHLLRNVFDSIGIVKL